MNTKHTAIVSLRIILLFATAIMLSTVPDYFHNFFGDVYCGGNQKIGTYCPHGRYGIRGVSYHWGYRHWLYFSMGVCLSVIQIMNIINYISKNEI